MFGLSLDNIVSSWITSVRTLLNFCTLIENPSINFYVHVNVSDYYDLTISLFFFFCCGNTWSLALSSLNSLTQLLIYTQFRFIWLNLITNKDISVFSNNMFHNSYMYNILVCCIWNYLEELIWVPMLLKCTYLFRHISV